MNKPSRTVVCCPLHLQEKLQEVVEGLEEQANALDRTLSDTEREEQRLQVRFLILVLIPYLVASSQ